MSLLLKTFVFQSFWIPSGSMENTLEVKDRILVSLWRPGPLDVRRGDVVVFKDPGGWLGPSNEPEPTGLAKGWNDFATFVGLLPQDAGEHLVKRVIGLPGETVACDPATDTVSINGVDLVEDYIKPGTTTCTNGWEVTVPEGRVWVLGDNRSNSADSRAHLGEPGGGMVPVDNIVGTAFVTAWPFDHWKTFGNPY
nr:signal peptidase I [Demequina sp. TTPB684]